MPDATASGPLLPQSWGCRRWAELLIALYQGAVGAVIWAHPASFEHSSYAVLREIAHCHIWSIVLCAIALGHVGALILNGRHPWRSSLLRLGAILLHLCVLGVMAYAFLVVDPPDLWRVTTSGFAGFLIYASLSIAAEDMKRARRPR